MTEDPGRTGIETIRRDFAAAWGHIGSAWGVAPSTAAVQGYLLVHGGPLTSGEIQQALGLSHRSAGNPELDLVFLLAIAFAVSIER